MSDDFDPDKFLAETEPFDPDKFLAETAPTPTAKPKPGFNPNKLGSTFGKGTEAFIHGGVDAIPAGQKLTAGGSSAALNFLKWAGEHGMERPLRMLMSGGMDAAAMDPRAATYFSNIAPTSFGEQQARERGQLAQSEQAFPSEHWYTPTPTKFGQLLGGGASMAALAPFEAAQGAGLVARTGAAAANAGLYGTAHGIGRGDTIGESLTNAAVEGPMSAALGGAGHALLGEAAPAVARRAGNGLQDFAGWLKVNSLHPVPTISEQMAELPGGTSAVGRTLLRRWVGGFNKGGTADQVRHALDQSSAAIDNTAAALDATGLPAPDLERVASQALWRDAVPMTQRPLTRATGERLGNTLAEYENIYAQQPATFRDALGFRRELDDAIYRNTEFGADPTLSAFGRSLQPVRGDVNAALDRSAANASPELAAQFRTANLETRQLGLASRAAERSAGRTTSNHPIGLKDLAAAGIPIGAGGAAGAAVGHGPIGLALGAGSWLLGKYGSQVGARIAYGAGAGLRLTPEAAAWLAQRSPAGMNALRSSAPAALNMPALRYAGQSQDESEATLSQLYAQAMQGRGGGYGQ